MYITPTSPAPICEASRMRCASPPDRVSALRFEGQVVQAHIDQEAVAGAQFLQDFIGDFAAAPCQLQLLEIELGLTHRHGRDAGQVAAIDKHVARIASQAGALAFGAGLGGKKFGQFLPHRLRIPFRGSGAPYWEGCPRRGACV